jgi:hypothetical protein
MIVQIQLRKELRISIPLRIIKEMKRMLKT